MAEIINLKNNESDYHQEHEKVDCSNNEGFSSEHAKEHVESLVDDFKEYFSLLGYNEIDPVKISSGIDKSVRFVGSHISVFKPYLINENVPEPGVFMRQDCLRVRNANKLLDDDYCPNWGSFFTSIGALASPDRLNDVCLETFVFFEKVLGVSRENVKIRVSSADEDLMSACRQCYGVDNLEIDTNASGYYKHTIGLEGVRGRSFNIALRNNASDSFADVGNIIVLEDDDKKLGIEVALGVATILKQLYILDHVQDCTPVLGLGGIKNEAIRRKFEDSIITSVVLYNEGLRPFGNDNRNRILKKYVQSLGYFMSKSGMSFDGLERVISDFEESQSYSNSGITSIIMEHVKHFEGGKIVS